MISALTLPHRETVALKANISRIDADRGPSVSAVTRGLDHRKSDVSDLRPFKGAELGNTRVLVVHLLRVKVLAKRMDCTKVECFRLWLF